MDKNKVSQMICKCVGLMMQGLALCLMTIQFVLPQFNMGLLMITFICTLIAMILWAIVAGLENKKEARIASLCASFLQICLIGTLIIIFFGII